MKHLNSFTSNYKGAESHPLKPLSAPLFFMAVLIFTLAISTSVRADTNITNCTTLNTAGEIYILTQNISNNSFISGSWDCIFLNTSDIILDCQNYYLIGEQDTGTAIGRDDFENYNILPKITNITVRNCNFLNWSVNIGIQNNISNFIILNNSFNIYPLKYAISLSAFEGTEIYNEINITENKFFNGSSEFASQLNLINMGSDNYVYNNYFTNIINFSSESYISGNPVNWNITNQSGTRIYSSGTQIGGNYWTNSTANGYSDTCADANTDGFCDNPYDVETGAACAAIEDGLPACGNNTDWLPLSPLYEEPPAAPPAPTVKDNTVVCFQTQPVCINLKDSSLIYKREGYYA